MLVSNEELWQYARICAHRATIFYRAGKVNAARCNAELAIFAMRAALRR